MKIYVYPADTSGCGYYRLIWPAEQLRRDGHDVVVVAPQSRSAFLTAVVDSRTNKIVDVQIPADTDVMVLQRISSHHLVDAIELIRSRGVTVVVDIDDDLNAIHPANPAFHAMHPTHGLVTHNWKNTRLACERASYVTVSTDSLLKIYAPHGRGRVLTNCVPRRYLDVKRHDSNVVGWGGSVHSHPDDLQVMGMAITQLTRDGVQFRVVGDGRSVRDVLRLDFEPTATGVVDIHFGWPTQLANLGIGVAPLADSRFNASKSWLKPLEYAALGVPCVVSPRSEYEKLHALGVGVLARKPRDWLRQLQLLTSDESARTELSERGRAVASKLTIEDNAWRWLEAWSDAYQVDH